MAEGKIFLKENRDRIEKKYANASKRLDNTHKQCRIRQ